MGQGPGNVPPEGVSIFEQKVALYGEFLRILFEIFNVFIVRTLPSNPELTRSVMGSSSAMRRGFRWWISRCSPASRLHRVRRGPPCGSPPADPSPPALRVEVSRILCLWWWGFTAPSREPFRKERERCRSRAGARPRPCLPHL